MTIRVAKVAPELEQASSTPSSLISPSRPPPRLPPLSASKATSAAADDDFLQTFKSGHRTKAAQLSSDYGQTHEGDEDDRGRKRMVLFEGFSPSVSSSPLSSPPLSPRLVAPKPGSGQNQEGDEDGRARKGMVVVEGSSSLSLSSSPLSLPPPLPPPKPAPAPPGNYAYAHGSGYEGLLLHRISPRLAVWAFPFLSTPTADLLAFMTMSLASFVGTLPLLLPSLCPGWLTGVSLLIFVAVLHRACFTDLTVMPLLLHQFDTWFLLFNNAVMAGCGFTSMFSPGARFVVMVLNTGSLITLVLDAIRAPLRGNVIYLALTSSCAGVSFLWAGIHTLKLGPQQVFDYSAVLVGRTPVASVFAGRMATQGFFFLRYTFKLWWRPDAHVVLHRPVQMPTSLRRSRYTIKKSIELKIHPQGDGTSTPSSSSSLASRARRWQQRCLSIYSSFRPSAYVFSTRGSSNSSSSSSTGVLNATTSSGHPLRDTSSTVVSTLTTCTATTPEHLILDMVLPRSWPIEYIYRCLIHQGTDNFVLACLVVGLCLPLGCGLLPTVFAPQLAYASLLLSLHSLQRLLFTEPRLFRPIFLHFDTLWLLITVALALICLFPGIGLVHQRVEIRISNVGLLLSFLTAICVDATHLSSRSKMLSIGAHTAGLLSTVVLLTLGRLKHFDFEATVLNGATNVSSFYAARLLMLGVYGVRYMFKLWLRPDCYVVIHKPLLREERERIMAFTLRIRPSDRVRAFRLAIEAAAQEEDDGGTTTSWSDGGVSRATSELYVDETADWNGSSGRSILRSSRSGCAGPVDVVSEYPGTTDREKDRKDQGAGAG